MKPYSESCEQNRLPIFEIIEPILKPCQSVLEIGSGTGQHAVYFAKDLPHLIWHTSDVKHNHLGINLWVEEAQLDNVRSPIELDTQHSTWPDLDVDAVYSANTVHIMHQADVDALFDGVGRLLSVDGKFILYGPFNYEGTYNSESNKSFDQWLKARDSLSGIKHFEALVELAEKVGLELVEDYEMPANNRILYWKKI